MREMDEWWSKRTVEEVLGERVVGHELGDEQALVAVAAVADQVRHPPVAQAPHPLGLLLQPNQPPVRNPRILKPHNSVN